MDYSFIRRLTKNLEKDICKQIYNCLAEKGIEVFLKKENEYTNWSNDACKYAEEFDLYVSAADLEYARELVTSLGLDNVLCSEIEAAKGAEKSAVELAEEEFYRKHRQNQIFAWVVIAAVIVFMIFQFFM